MFFASLSNSQKYQAVANFCSIMELDQDLYYQSTVDYFKKYKRRFNPDGTFLIVNTIK